MLAILLPDLSTLSFCNSWPNFHYALLAHTASRCRRAYIFYRCGFLFLSFLLSFFFFPSFSTPNLWGHWTDLNQTWTRIHLWFLFEQFGPNSPCIYPHGLGTKKNVFGPTLKFDRTYLCNGTWYQQSEKNWSIYIQGLPYMQPNLVNFGSETAENGWRVFAHPLNFRIGRHCQPYRGAWMLYNR